jgi:hypothetical protein
MLELEKIIKESILLIRENKRTPELVFIKRVYPSSGVELMPRQDTQIDGVSAELAQAIIDAGYVKESDKIKELENKLEAWYTAFGTTQLTHALDRLNYAERWFIKKEEPKCSP